MKKALLFISFILGMVCHVAAQLHSYSPSHVEDLRFSENKGQWNKDIVFRSDIPNGKMFLGKNGFFFSLVSPTDLAKIHHPGSNGKIIIHGHAFKEIFEGARPEPRIKGETPASNYENYYLGNDPAKWAVGVKIFQKIKYEELYVGIDLSVAGRGENNIKYDFTVKPGADASQIKIRYDGVDKLQLLKEKLLIKTSVGNLMEEKPFAYQDINNTRKEVKCNFVLQNDELTFDLPEGYDTNFPLVIDPDIIFSTYTGTQADNWGYTATYDNDGNMYLAGLVRAADPYLNNAASPFNTTTGAFQSVWGGGNDTEGIQWACDMGVSKFSSDGTNLLYRTFIGGNNNETPNSMVVDAQDNLIIYGVSYSNNFPVTAGSYRPVYKGNGDIVVVKLNAGGTALLGSTFVGGTLSDGVNFDASELTGGHLKKNYGDQNRGEVNIDAGGNIYVASCTNSSDFPVTPGVVQPAFGGTQDGCVFKLNNNCSQLLWSTFLGGSNDDACYSLDIGAGGTLYVAGGTMSNNFHTTPGTIHTNYQGGDYDGFVAHINASGSQLISSTYIGTNGNDQVYCIKLDDEKNVYFMGQTTGAYPVHNAAYSNPNSGQFISKLKPELDSVFYSTVFGNGSGKPNISPTAFLVDTCQNVYVAGWGTSSSTFTDFDPTFENEMHNMPLTGDAFQSTTDGTDFYFFVLAKNAQSILYGSYFGGDGYIDHVDGGTSRFDKRGIIYEAICAGCAVPFGPNSLTPTTPGAWSQTNDSWNCNELGLKIAFNLSAINLGVNAYPRATGCVPLTVQFQSDVSNVQFVEWYFADGDSSAQMNPVHTFMDTGTFNVMLVGYNPNACKPSDTAYVSVVVGNDSLTATFQPHVVNKCDSFFVHLNSAYFSGASYLWNSGDGNYFTTDSLVHYYATPGQYTVTLIVKDSSRCNLVDTFSTQITVPQNGASFTISGADGCAPVAVQFNAAENATAIFLWSFGDGSASNTVHDPIHTYDTAGTYSVSLKVIDTTCGHVDSLTTIVHISSITVKISPYPRTTGCIPLTVQFQDSGSTLQTVVWHFGNGDSSTELNPTYTFKDTGTYNVMLIGSNSNICTSLDTAYMVVVAGNDSVLATFDTHLINKCDSFFIQLNTPYLESATYLWSTGDGNHFTVDSLTHYYATPGQYAVTLIVTDSARCNNVDSLSTQITIPQNLASFTLSDTGGCPPLKVQFDAPSTTNTVFLWSFGDGSAGSATPDPVHTYHGSGIYHARLIVVDTQCNHIDSAISVIDVYQRPIADFYITGDSFQFQVPITFTNTSNGYTHIIWNFGDADTVNDENTPLYTYQSPGAKTICISVSNNNCVDTMCKDIYIVFTALIGVPNAFSPNGDGVNDVVKVEGKGIVEITFRIYNRWGEKLFETHDPNEGWDGTYKGVRQEVEVYTYTVEATLLNGQHVPLKGNITLLK